MSIADLRDTLAESARIHRCAERLGVDHVTATQIVNRNLDLAQSLVEALEACEPERCCRSKGCDHSRRLAAARGYRDLAWVHAPTDQPTFPCRCGGTGIYEGNGGVCHGCKGKGWQDNDDRIRNRTYWRHRATRNA